LEPHLGIAHVALDLRARYEGRDGVDREDVECARADERVGDLERLLAVVGLGDEEVLGLDPELPRVADVERVLGVDEGRDAAALLRLGDQLEGERRLARRLRAVDLDHASARDAADTERNVESERAGRQRRDVLGESFLAQLHDRALAELLLDLADGEVDRPLAVHVDAHVPTPSPARSAPVFRRWATLPRPLPSLQHGAWIFSAPRPPQRMAADGDMQGAGRPEAALVEDQLGGDPGAEVTAPDRLDGIREAAATARGPRPAEGQMAAERTRLGGEPEGRGRAVDPCRERRGVRAAGRDPGPEHTGAPEARKAAETRGGERQRRGPRR